MSSTFRLTTDLDTKKFVALVSAVCKKRFGHRGGDEEAAARAIRKAVATSKRNDEEVAEFIEEIGKFVEHAGRLGWGATEVANIAASDQVDVEDQHAKALVQFWKGEVDAIRRSLGARVTFNQKISNFNWRIDVKGGNDADGGGTACALFEMNIANRVSVCCPTNYKFTKCYSMHKSAHN